MFPQPIQLTPLVRVLVALLLLIITDGKEAFAQDTSRVNSEIIAESHYSHYNFTDVTYPETYNGIDTWIEHRLQIWGDKHYKSWGGYVSTMLSNATSLRDPLSDNFFNWQRFAQLGIGIQYYPFHQKDTTNRAYDALQQKDTLKHGYNPLFGLRFFAMFAGRAYYFNTSKNTTPFSDFKNLDLQVGADYYFDNLFDTVPGRITFFAWSNLSYRLKNFSHDGYRNILWTGNIKAGPKIWSWAGLRRLSVLIPYATVDWTYTRTCSCRWWENYLRVGPGIRFYPRAYQYRHDPHYEKASRLWRRFHVYIEGLYNAAWLGNKAPSVVKNWDFRIGIGLSTPGFVRQNNELYER